MLSRFASPRNLPSLDLSTRSNEQLLMMIRIRVSGSQSGRIFEFWPDQDQNYPSVVTKNANLIFIVFHVTRSDIKTRLHKEVRIKIRFRIAFFLTFRIQDQDRIFYDRIRIRKSPIRLSLVATPLHRISLLFQTRLCSVTSSQQLCSCERGYFPTQHSNFRVTHQDNSLVEIRLCTVLALAVLSYRLINYFLIIGVGAPQFYFGNSFLTNLFQFIFKYFQFFQYFDNRYGRLGNFFVYIVKLFQSLAQL